MSITKHDSPPVDGTTGKVRKVMHLRTVTGAGGGPEKTILNSPLHIGDGYDMRLVYFRPYHDELYDLPQRAADLGVQLIDIPESGPLDPRAVRRLFREVRAYRPDVLHAHDYKSNLLGLLVGRWYRIPVVTTMHGYVFSDRRLSMYYRLDRWLLTRMQHIVVVSEELRQVVLDLNIPSSRCSLIDNAIDSHQFRRTESSTTAKERFAIAPERVVIGAVGRLSPEKGFDVLIRAADRLIAEGHDVELLIAGEGSERIALEALIETLGRSDRIRLLGQHSNIIDVFSAMDVFALSSYREGLPNVVLEAMAMGVPVVATSVARVPGMIDSETDGLLVPAGDLDQLASSLARLVEEGDLRNRIGSAGRRKIERDYCFTSRMKKIRAVYDRLANGASRRSGDDQP